MNHVLQDMQRSLRSAPIFTFYLLATLVAAGIIGLITVGVIDLGFSHFGDPAHRPHDLTYGFLFTTGVMGILAQFRRPEKNVAAMVMALIPGAALLLAGVLSGDVDTVVRFNPLRQVAALTVVAALVHPAGRRFFRTFRRSRVNWVMLALVGAGAMPLLAFASTNIRLQQTVTDVHAGSGHYGFMAALSFTVIGVGILASLRPVGWKLTAWVAGLLALLLGITSMLYPDTTSSLAPGWALAAVAWGVMFLAAAATTRDPANEPDRTRDSDSARDQAADGPAPKVHASSSSR